MLQRSLVLLLSFTASLVASPQASIQLDGLIRDASGLGISDAVVILRAGESRVERDRVRTDASGAFRLSARAPGGYAMQVEAQGFMTVNIDTFQLPAVERKTMPPITLQTGYGCGEPVVRRLRLAENGATDLGTITGGLADGKERPLGPADLTLICDDKGPCATILTDPSGRFTISNLPPGKYSLRVQKRGYFEDVRKPLVVQAGYQSEYWPLVLERCHGHNCQADAKRRRPSNCE